jgi:hypothetical protein
LRAAVAVVVLVVLELPAGCGAQSMLAAVPRIDPVALERSVVKADDLRRQALATAAGDGLEDGFAGFALERLRRRTAEMRRRQERLEERPLDRKLVHSGPEAQRPEGVLAVSAETRLVTPDRPDPAWSRTLRQWQASLGRVDGTWRVVEERELPPDHWWHA